MTLGKPAITHVAPSGHLNGLDGLRGLAAVAVVAFHSHLPGFGGGFLGVDVFFVLSGYLTASIVLGGRYRVGEFMLRRLLRLWPLMLTFGVLVTVAHLALYGSVPRGVAYGLLFAMDVVTTTEGSVGWFSHYWTLALELRFYLLLCILAAVLDRRSFFATVIFLFLASTTYRMGVAADFNAAYYGFASHSSGLFLGAACAARPVSIPRPLYLLAIPTLLIALAVDNWKSPVAVIAMIPIVELASLAVILHLSQSSRKTILDSPVMARAGELSFGIYVWHYPFALALRDDLPAHLTFAIALVLSTFLATLSLRFVERPMRNLAWSTRSPTRI